MNRQALGDEWYELLKEEIEQPYFQTLRDNLNKEYQTVKCFPTPGDVFKAFKLTPFSKVRVILIGQDPYPFGNHADGLAFSSKLEDTPASLRVILREVDRDVVKTNTYQEYKRYFPTNSLVTWADRGVMLLNSCLTVRAGDPGSHNGIGWQQFTTKALELLAKDEKPKVFVAWGKDAKEIMKEVVDKVETNTHKILEAGHPASGSHGKDLFSGCNHFSKINHYFIKKGLEPINWTLND